MSKREDPASIKILKAKIDFAAFGKAALEALRSAINGEYGDSLKTLISYFSGHFDTPEDQLYRLVWVASTNAFVRILKNKFGDRFESVYGKSPEELFLAKDLAAELYQIEFSADAAFLTEPHRHPQIEPLKAFFKTWLVNTLQISEEQAAISTAAFPRLFLNEFNQIDPTLYNHLLAYFERPAYHALKREALIEAYHAHIMAEYDRPAFSDLRVSLDDMYVEPNFLYYKPEKDKAEAALSKDDFYPPAPNLPLHHFITDWLKEKSSLKLPKQNAPILLLLGQPGQGKSSFVYRTIYKLLGDEQDSIERVFMIRLRDLSTAEEGALMLSPLEVVLDKINKQGFDEHRLSLNDFDQSLLILDGLDELYMNRGLSLEDIQIFLSNLKKAVKGQSEKFNNPVHLKCIVTSRHNYVRIHDFKAAEDLLVLSLAEMNMSQQKEWLAKYKLHFERILGSRNLQETENYLQNLNKLISDLSENDYDLPKDKKNLRELLNQPILLQLIVEARAELDDRYSLVSVFENIFTAVTERKYADSQKISSLKNIDTQDYRRFLQVLAIQIYTSNNLYIRRSDFEKEPLKKEITRICEKVGCSSLSARDLAKDLLVGFYFRSVRKNQDIDEKDTNENYAFEFMHNSLFEYLVAEYIFNYFSGELIDTDSKDKSFKTTYENAFRNIFKMFSPRILTNEIVQYLRAMIEGFSFTNPQKSNLLFQRLQKELFPNFAKHDFLTEYKFNNEVNKLTPFELALSVFYGVISITGYLAYLISQDKNVHQNLITNYLKIQKRWDLTNFIDDSDKDRIIDFIQLLRRTDSSVLIDIAYQILIGVDLSGINLQGANLVGSDLSGAIFNRADLRESYFYDAFLFEAIIVNTNFSSADLRRADISNAQINESDFSGADFSGAILYFTNCKKVNFSNANFIGATFHGSNLSRVDFRRADLRGADLSETALKNVDFRGADLTGANLSGASLHNVNFKGAYLGNLQFKDVTMKNVIFASTIFEKKLLTFPNGAVKINGD